MMSTVGRIFFLAALAIVCVFMSLARAGQVRRKATAQYVGSITVPSGLQGIIPEDVSSEGWLLLLAVPKSPAANEQLLLFDT